MKSIKFLDVVSKFMYIIIYIIFNHGVLNYNSIKTRTQQIGCKYKYN